MHHQIIQECVNAVLVQMNRRPPTLQVGCQSYFNQLIFHGNNKYDLAASFSVMSMVPPVAVSNNALAMQVAFDDDGHKRK